MAPRSTMPRLQGPTAPEAPGTPRRQSLARDLAGVAGGLVLGVALPLPLFILFAGVPYAFGPIAGIARGPLGLEYEVGLAVWYVVLGVIGGILPAKPGAAYLFGGLLILQVGHAIVWPSAALAAVAWLIVMTLLQLLDSDRL